MIDFDGKTSFSSIVALNMNRTSSWKVLTNPAVGSIRLQNLNPTNGKYNFRLLDATGREVVNQSLVPQNGMVEVETTSLKSGLYWIQISDGFSSSMLRVFIQ